MQSMIYNSITLQPINLISDNLKQKREKKKDNRKELGYA